ncbi:MAG: hypothetical protein FRX49_06811 [Trebouxia sp. A1-2]|nr:MAG: hypothetical protein FRX49_06811 [Trebouxia sp. A1-2]
MVMDAHAPQPASPAKSSSSELDHNNPRVQFDYSAFPDEGLYDEDPLDITPQKHSELMSLNQHIAHSCSLPDDGSLEHSPQISPSSVLPTHNESPLKACNFFNSMQPVSGRLDELSMPACSACMFSTLLDRSQSLQIHKDNPGDEAAEFQKLRHQHAQLLAFNHVLVEENNHRLVDHAELVSELMSANQKAYQAEQASATAVSNAAQLQREVLRLSNQMDALRLDLQTQSSLANSQQEQLEAAHEQMTEQQRNNLAKMEKQGWEAADWKARALDSTQKLAAANAQIAEQARVIVLQEQKYAKDVMQLNAQLMHYSAAVGIQSFSPVDLGEDDDD